MNSNSELFKLSGVLLEKAQNDAINYYKLVDGRNVAIVTHEGKYFVCTIRDGHLAAAGQHDSYLMALRAVIHMLVGCINQQVAK